MDAVELVTKDAATDPSKRSQFFDQYKLYVDSAQKNSDRRAISNSFFLAVCTALIGFIGVCIKDNPSWVLLTLIPISGIVISLLWLQIIESYKNLNSAKFNVIHKIEEDLPLRLFEYEWELLKKGKTKQYIPLTHIERFVPALFCLLFLVIAIRGIYLAIVL